MVKYNENSDYELMELAKLTQLKSSRLLLATISTIDRLNNCAAIILTEPCEDLIGKDLSEVKFFYHCEYSTGTLEDLLEGHKAFAVSDLVYVVYVPSFDTQAEQLYINGHAGMRGTRMCLNKEYLRVVLSFAYNAVWHSYTTMYEAESGLKMDLAEFENLPGSPAKPAGFPITSSAMDAWYTYNFEAPLVTPNLGGIISVSNRTQYYTWWEQAEDISDDVWYTGDSYDLCNSFGIGNAHYKYSSGTEYLDNNYENQPVDYRSVGTTDRLGVTKYELGDTYCRGYWTTYTINVEYTYKQDRSQIGYINSRGYHALWHTLDWEANKNVQVTNDGDTTEITSSQFTYSYNFNTRTYIDFSSICDHTFEHNLSWSSSVSGNLSLPPTWDNTVRNINKTAEFSSTQALNAFPDFNLDTLNLNDTYRLCPWLTTMASTANCFKQGFYYVYGLLGALSAEQWYPATVHSVCEYVGARYGVSPNVWPEYVDAHPDINGQVYVKIVPNARTTVTSIFDDMLPIPPEEYMQIYDAIKYSNKIKAQGLNDTINELFQFAIDICNPVDINDIEALIYVLRYGPSANVAKKKNI